MTLAAIGLCTLSAVPAFASEYKIANKFHIDGNGGWDFCSLDDATGRLFVSHENQVQVLDVNSGQQIGVIPDTKGVHGIAFVPEQNKAYVSNGKDGSVTVVDLKTLAFLQKTTVTGTGPDVIVYEPFSKTVFVMNGKSANATVIDVKNDSVVATIPVDGKPEFATSDETGHLFLNLEDKEWLKSSTPKP